jgi:hypothetical protein
VVVVVLGVSHAVLQRPVPCRRHKFGALAGERASATGVAGSFAGKNV